VNSLKTIEKQLRMANNENLKKAKGFDKMPENINKEGRPKGVKNRSTIVSEIFAMTVNYPEEVLAILKEMCPSINNNVTIEEAMTVMQASKAIQDKDTAAYKVLMDSAYGQPNQKTDITTKGKSLNDPYEDLTVEELEEKLNELRKPIKGRDKDS